MTRQRLDILRQPFFWWVSFLLVLIAGGLIAASQVFMKGLVVTNLSDKVPWGLWITIDLSAIALSAGAFLFSAAVYLLGLKELKHLARTAVFVGLIGYSIACMMLLLDIGRPDRFWHGFVFWNVHSPLWEVTMCVGLYFSVLTLEVMPIIGQWSWLKSRFPRLSAGMQWIHHLAPYLAILGLGLSMLHQSSLGATYGILKARPYWYQPGLAVLFMVSAMAGGPALTVLISKIAARVSTRATVDQGAIDKATRFIGWVLVAFLYMRFWDLLSTNYTYAPGRSEAMALLTRGPLALNFWVGEIGLGIILPIILLLGRPFRQHDRYQVLALFLVAAGVVAYRWDINMAGLLVVTGQTPHVLTPLYAAYTPSLVEMAAGAGVIAYGALAFSLGVRYLDVVRGGTPVVQAESARVQTAPRLSISSSSS